MVHFMLFLGRTHLERKKEREIHPGGINKLVQPQHEHTAHTLTHTGQLDVLQPKVIHF